MLFLLLIPFCISMIILGLLWFEKKPIMTIQKHTKKVSVLVAVRNEEACIIKCLESLAKQNYPNYEVWIGNDHSSDQSVELITQFINNYPNFHLYHVQESTHTKGKANVLAQLAYQAQGEYFCMTDADIEVPQTWITKMMEVVEEDTGIVSGVTWTKRNSMFGTMQAIDWLFSQQMIHYLSHQKIPVTALGNNLLVSKKAYVDIGGYENIPFSITEDFALFHAIVNKGWKFKHVFQESVLAESEPTPSFYQLLQQRKRWTQGAIELPFWLKSLLINQVIYVGTIPFLFDQNWLLGIMVIIVKVFLQTLVISKGINKLHQKVSSLKLIMYEFYQVILGVALMIFYVLPIKIQWKGRKY